ncbi:MAG: AraC family transcriptional regulator [Treponema sp.]|nr:AraC family transcriptional regulator [Treponema sp.]
MKSDNNVYNGVEAHCHKECEIFYMINGGLDIYLEGHVYHVVSDSLLLMPSNVFHQRIYPLGKISHRISIHFLPEMLSKTERGFFQNLFTEPLHFLDVSRYDLNFYIQAVTECELMEKPLQKIAVKIRLKALLSQIHYLSSTKAAKPVVLDERIMKVITYLEKNFKKDISLDDLADRFCITKNHLNFLFHNMVGMPIKKYIIAKRLGFARHEILDGERLTQVAYHAGFHDYATFYRAYKLFYGLSPSEQSADGVNN